LRTLPLGRLVRGSTPRWCRVAQSLAPPGPLPVGCLDSTCFKAAEHHLPVCAFCPSAGVICMSVDTSDGPLRFKLWLEMLLRLLRRAIAPQIAPCKKGHCPSKSLHPQTEASKRKLCPSKILYLNQGAALLFQLRDMSSRDDVPGVHDLA